MTKVKPNPPRSGSRYAARLHNPPDRAQPTREEQSGHIDRRRENGKWSRLRAMALETWPELTEEDFTRAEGSVDDLYAVIQERVGDSRTAIVAKLELLRREREP